MTSPQGTGPTPAGWYPDPSGSGQQRYWDGSAWTEHYAPGAGQQPAAQQPYGQQHGYGQQQGYAPQYGQPAAAQPAGPVPNLWWGAPAAALLAIIGSAGTWVTASLGDLEESVTGFDGGDGWITTVTCLIAVGLLVGWRQMRQRGFAIGAAVLAAIGTLIPLIYVADPSAGVEGFGSIADYSRGWGLWVAFLGAGALTVISILLAVRRRDA